MPPEEQLQIDHLVVGVPDLQQGIDLVARHTGLRPVYGGEHPGSGTHNALLALGARRYLELLALRSDAKPGEGGGFMWELVDPGRMAELTGPELLTWAISTAKAERTIERLQVQGYEVSGLISGARKRPDGAQLAWKVFRVVSPEVRSMPFFIEWEEGSTHPAEASPGGCELVSLTVSEPEATGALRRLAAALDAEVEVKREAPSMKAVLKGPEGRLVLEGTY